MSKLYLIAAIVALFAIISPFQAQNFTLISESSDQVVYQHELDAFTENFVQINGQAYQNFSKTVKIVSDHLGEPAMPYYSTAVLLSNTGDVSFTVEFDSFYDIQGIDVAPSKGDLKRNVNPEDIPYTFGPVYQQNTFYPGELAQLSEPFNFRKTRGVSIALYPYQYNPVTHTLRVYENLRVKVNTDSSITGQNELIVNGLPASQDVLVNVYQNIFINPPVSDRRYVPVGEQGEMLIITAPEFVNALNPLVDWKIRKGIKTTLVTTNETGTTDTSIKDFVAAYYTDHPELINLLLVGDSDKIPAHSYGFISGEHRWSDSYYGQLVGGNNDFYPEVFVGRFSGNTSEIQTMVQRTLEYEINPMAGSWMRNALGIASNEGAGFGDDGESDFQHLRNIRQQLLNFGYLEVYEFYQGSQGGADAPGEPSPAMINNAVNAGVSLFNYTGHGWTEGMSTGNYTNSSVNQLQNNGTYPFVVSVACNNGTFVDATSLCEVMLRKAHNNQPAGFIAAAGSSILMSWAPPMQAQDEMANIITQLYEDNRKETLGGLFYNSLISVLVEYNNNGTAKEVMQTWVLFGDTSVSYRYLETLSLTATHEPTIPTDATSFLIETDVDEAMFALSQDNQVLGYGVSAGGSVQISIDGLLSENPVYVVGTKQNYKPYENTIVVGAASIDSFGLNNVLVYPNPADNVVTLDWSGKEVLKYFEIYDITGRLVNHVTINTQNTYQLDVTHMQGGIYLLKLYGETGQATKKLMIK